MAVERTTSWTGLTAWQVVVQSAAIHPDWDATIHAGYLINEEGFGLRHVAGLPIGEWLTDPKHPGYVGRVVNQLRADTIGEAYCNRGHPERPAGQPCGPCDDEDAAQPGRSDEGR